MKFIIDRFENDIAVCEDENGKIIEILKSQLPKNAETGDVIIQKITVIMSINKKQANEDKKLKS